MSMLLVPQTYDKHLLPVPQLIRRLFLQCSRAQHPHPRMLKNLERLSSNRRTFLFCLAIWLPKLTLAVPALLWDSHATGAWTPRGHRGPYEWELRLLGSALVATQENTDAHRAPLHRSPENRPRPHLVEQPAI